MGRILAARYRFASCDDEWGMGYLSEASGSNKCFFGLAVACGLARWAASAVKRAWQGGCITILRTIKMRGHRPAEELKKVEVGLLLTTRPTHSQGTP